MQQVDAREPVGVAIVDASAKPLRRNARHIGAIGEGGAHDVVLSLDAELSGPQRQHIVLELEFGAAEGRVLLRVDCLIEFETGTDLTRDVFTGIAGQLPIDEAVEARVVAGQFEPERTRRAPQTDLNRFRRLDAEIRVADIEGRGGVVAAAREQLGWFRRAFGVLTGDAGRQIPGKILDQADAAALRREVQIARRCRTDGGGIDIEIEKIRNEGGCGAAQIDVLDTRGDLRLGDFAELEFVEDVAGDLGVLVRVPQAVERAARIVRARRDQFLM